MARVPFLRTYTKTIPAGGEIGPLQIGGTRFVCKESDGVFDLWLDDVGPNECEVGVGFRFEDEDGVMAKFTTIRMANRTGVPITVKFWVGSAAVIDSRLNTLVDRTINVTVSSTADTYAKGTSGTLNPGITSFYLGTDGAKKRISFSVINLNTLASGDVIEVLGTNGISGHVVDGRQSYGVQSGSAIGIWNPGPNPVAFRVMETFPI